MGDSERLLYTLTVGDVVSGSPLVCQQETPIREAARILASSKATCLLVADTSGAAVGIVTDRDFATKVVAPAMSLDLPVSRIMSQPVVAVERNEPLFHALLAMLSHNIHHVLVIQKGVPAGVLTTHDLMVLQGKSPLNIVRHVEEQKTVTDLAAAQNRVVGLLPLLLREGAKASHITRVVAEVNDRLTAKVLQFAEEKLGPPPVPYCWVVLGSEGRREQTFKTDQDNALIYSDGGDNTTAQEYFTRLAGFAQDGLSACGYPLCPGNYMASNSSWRQPLHMWRSYFRSWISEPEVRRTEDLLILFDMRPVAGDFSLFKQLASDWRPHLKDASAFKSMLAFVSLEHKPPLGFFRNFVLERTGEHKNQLDLKLYGTGPIVNAVRLLALDAGVEHTNTFDRLAALSDLPRHDATLIPNLLEAFEFLTLLRIEWQLRQVGEGPPLSNYVTPDALTNLQRGLLKEAFRTIARVQSMIDETYRTAMWAQLGR